MFRVTTLSNPYNGSTRNDRASISLGSAGDGTGLE